MSEKWRLEQWPQHGSLQRFADMFYLFIYLFIYRWYFSVLCLYVCLPLSMFSTFRASVSLNSSNLVVVVVVVVVVCCCCCCFCCRFYLAYKSMLFLTLMECLESLWELVLVSSLLWRRANARNVGQHTLYGVQHIDINLTLIHCTCSFLSRISRCFPSFYFIDLSDNLCYHVSLLRF